MAVPYTQLDRLKLKLEIADVTQDDLLALILERAEDEILTRMYPFGYEDAVLPDRYRTTQLDIAEFLYGKRGAEGQTVHNENGVARTYEGGNIPPSMLSGITPRVGGF